MYCKAQSHNLKGIIDISSTFTTYNVHRDIQKRALQ